MGLVPSWREKKFTFLGTDWSYEIAVICKGYECFLEAGYQTLLQTSINMRTGWHGWLWLKQYLLGGQLIGNKGYLKGMCDSKICYCTNPYIIIFLNRPEQYYCVEYWYWVILQYYPIPILNTLPTQLPTKNIMISLVGSSSKHLGIVGVKPIDCCRNLLGMCVLSWHISFT